MVNTYREEVLSKVVNIIKDVCGWTQFMVVDENIHLYQGLNISRGDLHEVLMELEIKLNTHIPDVDEECVKTVGDLVYLVIGCKLIN